jgi:signal transduction histidine kinase/ActR/RegA family two-component response regulator
MSAPSSPGRLERCIRDLAALNALPSMCVGRSFEETLDIVVDALPVALDAPLLVLVLPGSPPRTHARFAGEPLSEPALAAVTTALGGPGGATTIDVPGAGRLFFADADLPVGTQRGRLLVARATPFEGDTDRVLVRSAANLVGTTLEAAIVLESARRKDEFLAILGHELRNPLAPILTAVELLARHPEAERERQVIERHTRHLARLVDDLLDISRVTSGHVELRSEEVTLATVLERAVELASPLVTRNRHELTVAEADDVTLRGDPMRLAQVFGNLLTNAAKFTPAGGHVSVTVDRDGPRVRVTVRDDGRGLARDQISRIFEPFVQVDREGDALRGGLGLGLAIVHNLVERHGGTIVAESDGPGRGAAFTVELPVVETPQPAAAVAEPQPSNRRAGVRVLVVDDNVDLAELLSEALEDLGFETAVAHDAQGALDCWRTFAPHAAVLDLGLPQTDGYELARTLRAEHGTGPTLIAATGYGQKTDRLRTADAGFDGHFVKPVSVHELALALDERVVRATPA